MTPVSLQNDVNLVINNTLLYHKPHDPFRRVVLKMRQAAGFILADLLRGIARITLSGQLNGPS